MNQDNGIMIIAQSPATITSRNHESEWYCDEVFHDNLIKRNYQRSRRSFSDPAES